MAVGGVVVGALTAGVGLLAGMMVVGMGAAGGGAAAAMSSGESKERSLVLASDSYHEAQNWRNAIEAQINDMGDHLLGFGGHGDAALRRNRNHAAVRPEVRLQEVEDWITTSKWKIYDVYEGVRLLQISHPPEATAAMANNNSNTGTTVRNNLTAFVSNNKLEEAPCMRVNIGINASTADTFSSIINFSNSLQTGIIKSMRIVENIDNFTDVIHLKLEPMFLYPSWTGNFCCLLYPPSLVPLIICSSIKYRFPTFLQSIYSHFSPLFHFFKTHFTAAPRDFCLIRYWRDNFDGSYVICLDSTLHPECPLVEGYVRGELHAAYIVAPPRVKVAGAYGGHVAKVRSMHKYVCCVFLHAFSVRSWVV